MTWTLSPKVRQPRSRPSSSAEHPELTHHCSALPDEEDAFESDFASTDEDESAYQDEDAEEREVRREEKHQRKVPPSSQAGNPGRLYHVRSLTCPPS